MSSAALRVAPLSDEELLGAVRVAFRQVIIPELERLGADEFTLSQVRATLSIVNFVRRGLAERALADAELARRAEALGAVGLDRDDLDPGLRRLLLERLEVEIESRSDRP